MAGKNDIWVFSDKPTLLTELVGGARLLAEKLGGSAVAVIIGPKSDADRVISLGADQVLWLGELKPGYMMEDYVSTIEAQINERGSFGMIIGATKRGKAIAGRLAARFGASAITDSKEFMIDGGAITARHMIFGGGANRIDKPAGKVMFATAGMGTFEAPVPDSARKGEVVEVAFVEPKWRLVSKGKKAKTVTAVNLAAAKRVVCPGLGVSKQEDLGMIQELATALEAEIGCTRPLAEGLDWYPRERYIGVSGAFLKADVYFGIGVSGQVQHTVGITESKVIVAINKDKNALIFPQADYGIVGNLYEVIPVLIKAIQARK